MPSAELTTDSPVASSPSGRTDRKELGAIAFERTRMPIVMTEADGHQNPIVLANQAFLDLTGYSSDEVIGQDCRFLQGKGTSTTAVAQIRSGLADGKEINVELLNYRKDGSPFWNQLHISPIRDDDGKIIYYFASQLDVTEFRRIESLEASEHRLLKEVDHRSKNVLAIIDSIVRLSSADDPARYASAIQHRVQALARVHGLLAESGWQPVPLDLIIRQQLEPFGGTRAVIRGPEIKVPPVDAQPIALVFHELAVNAATHGALKDRSGSVEVGWQPLPSGGFQVRWLERGTRKPETEMKRGFGTVMVDAVIEKQMGGRIYRNWADEGLAIAIEIPQSSS